MIKITVSDVLIDIDGTISNGCGVGDPHGALIQAIMNKFGLTYREALQKIEDLVGKDGSAELKQKGSGGDLDDLFDLAACLEISRSEYWQVYMRDIGALYFRDATYMVKTLHAMNFPLYTASNNKGWPLLVKLGYSHLGTIKGSKYFKDFLHTEKMGFAKDNPQYYRRALEYLKRRPEDVVMIGDWELIDLYPALEAGLRHVIIVRRGQREKLKIRDAVYVNSLRLVPEILEKKL